MKSAILLRARALLAAAWLPGLESHVAYSRIAAAQLAGDADMDSGLRRGGFYPLNIGCPCRLVAAPLQ